MNKNKNSHRMDKAVMNSCIEGLGVYASLMILERHSITKAEDIRVIINNFVPYWGLADGEGSKSVDEFLQNFDDMVDEAIRSGGIDADLYKVCADILTGLVRHGEELIVAQGSSAMEDILKMGDLLKEVADYMGFSQEIAFANDSAKWLKNSVQGMLNTYDFPGVAVDGDMNANYEIKRATLFSDNVGFAFAHNPEAASPFVTWRMFNNDGKLRHAKHPVMDWNMKNVVVEQDAAGNIKPSKRKSTEKIDGVVALIMGLARAMLDEGGNNGSVYDNRGILFI